MRITKQEAALNRAHIVEAAAQLFREKGFEGAAVADLMRAAGLTHGGFYNHFASKEELEAAACGLLFERAIATLERLTTGASALERKTALADYVAGYLSAASRDAAVARCPMVALTADATRQAAPIRQRFAEGVRHFIETLASALGREAATPRQQRRAREAAIVMLATLVGGLLLARGVKESDGALSDDILDTTRRAAASEL